MTPQEAMQRAFAAYGRGDWSEAEQLCRRVLGAQPGQLQALNILGIIAAQTGRTREAADLLSQIAVASPKDAAAHCNLGNVLHVLQRLEEALASYEVALRLQPDYADALNNRGVVLGELGRHAQALESYGRAIALRPAFAEAHKNRGSALRALGRSAEAVESYGRAIALRPDYAEAHDGCGVVLRDLGRHLEAVQCHERAIAIRPGYADAHNNRGIALRGLERHGEGLESFERAIALAPDYAVPHNNRAVALGDLGRYAEALESCDRAIALRPGYADAHNNRGNALRDLGRPAEALESYERAIALDPGRAQTRYNRGVVLRELRRHAQALESYGQAIGLEPGHADAYNGRGLVFGDIGDLAQALESFDRAIALRPDYADAWSNRGNVLRDLKRYPEAIAAYGRALQLDPDYEWLYGTWLHARMQVCDWQGFDEHCARLGEAIGRRERAAPPFVTLSLPGTAALQRIAAETWVRESHPPRNGPDPAATHAGHAKVRIAYVSADFREHAVARAMVEVFERHDRAKFELTAISLGPESGDAVRQRIVAAFDRWIDVRGRPDAEVAALARELGIDIAVDLGGFTQGCRTDIFAMRAAPVQVSYIGYLGTLGAPYMDYLVADATIIPAEHRKDYAEKIAYLPSYQANDSARQVSDRVYAREELGLPGEGFVFCCFNNNYKITPATFDSWMRILQRVDGSVLLLYAENDFACANLGKEAASRGVDPARLVFGRRLPADQYLARYRAVDLFLDTLPYNAGVTASDALWVGVPVLTCLGETFAGRVGASLLKAAGVPELIAPTREQFEAIAVDLATDPGKLRRISRQLADNRPGCRLFDSRRFTRSLEAAFSRMHERRLAGLPPEHIHVED